MNLPTGSNIQINVIDDAEMLRIGKEYKDKDYPTDVLTFNYSKTAGYKKGDLFGEIYVNKNAAKRQAKENGNTVEQEIAFLVQHSMLHMQGIHHEGDN
ncbi:rRNA maturation RNase YbeY [bacterium]|nr:rRNA maturation RNase YbeY [bacterium]